MTPYRLLFFLAAALLVTGIGANAQLNPFGAVYYQNQYQLNPAMAGLEAGLVTNLGYRNQFSATPGTPNTQAVTIEYGPQSRNLGVGLNFNSDKAGLESRTRLVGTFAYHLVFDSDEGVVDGEQRVLSFGASFGMLSDHINSNRIKGDPTDIEVGDYNARRNYLDGDAGIAYSGSGLTVQGAIPNIKNFFKRDDSGLEADVPTYMVAASYRLSFTDSFEEPSFAVEPKVCFRGVNGYKNVWDAGVNIGFGGKLFNIMGVYHSSQSTTVGAGVNFGNITFTGLYTTETAAIRSYANGDFEVGLKIKVF
ncbi:PorP/SprF family type IX secretion system membrane protein [Hufsiella ginkgonis]|uniref:Type IX secretion system membrane protein PorP/SprF n=1 Tax=Hufsiella ginkgonis TaxID=2695274 RepID=A0A7K1Y0V8_9SPHI|nr:PorP/SprF family type IX secretion system membrane protein [Hufsiella ginkgonis]MXV16880.1 type IX secretion system membrane protein PorP/SprF [Hufsiella ginkgonis]